MDISEKEQKDAEKIEAIIAARYEKPGVKN